MTDTSLIRSSDQSILNHLKKYISALETSSVDLSQLTETYKQIMPSIHKKFASREIDIGALTYSLTRLPRCFFHTEVLYIGQHFDDFRDKNISYDSWEKLVAPDRRRQVFYSREQKTAITFITSDSDIDDLINALIAFHIEWGKLGKILAAHETEITENENYEILGINNDEWLKLKSILGSKWKTRIATSKNIKDIKINLSSHSNEKYHQTARVWWDNISKKSLYLDFENTPIYFISSNLHSFVNIIGRYIFQKENDIFYYIHQKHPDLEAEWQSIKDGQNQVRITDFLYYISNKYFQSHPQELTKKKEYENGLGIKIIPSTNELLCSAQIIPINIFSRLNQIDPSIIIKNPEKISKSEALIINIDYPLGSTIYYILNQILNNQNNLKGMYLIGKAAILNGEIGDIQIPSSVFDERTGNIFEITNCFNSDFPLVAKQSQVHQNQKAICVHGPHLENDNQLKKYIQAGYNIIEMESGPFLSSILEWKDGQNISQNTVYKIGKTPVDYGIINYASDNPLSKTLGEGSMAIRGVEPTYMATLSVIQRILDLESR